jgi:hypothetical protein
MASSGDRCELVALRTGMGISRIDFFLVGSFRLSMTPTVRVSVEVASPALNAVWVCGDVRQHKTIKCPDGRPQRTVTYSSRRKTS